MFMLNIAMVWEFQRKMEAKIKEYVNVIDW